MADRVFAGIMLAIVVAYGAIAFTVIKAPFQYDPLGPESWPQILAVVAALCCVGLLIRPDTAHFDINSPTLVRIVAIVALLGFYAAMFEPLGFIIATALYCAAMTRLLGGDWLRAIAFGAVTGVLGYGVCTVLLDLNLPSGILPEFL